ncbi:MAG: DUF4321 domain-containing protein [Clostridiaceae bacterium]|nr:DUF4321 domain-containing protein [Clostridiaceae bacterium]
MIMRRERNTGLLVLLILIGIVMGGLLGEFLSQFKYLSFLSYGKEFGMDMGRPLFLDLSVIKFSFAIAFNVNIASILGIIASIFVYKRVI